MRAPLETRGDAVDRFCELANIGAGHAAGALASLVGRPIRMRVPQVVHSGARIAEKIDPAAGIFFEVLGGVAGDFAVFLTQRTVASLVASLVGEGGVDDDEDAASALSEVGNVLASHALSALADQIGLTLLPSPPELVFGDASSAFRDRVQGRTPWIENALEEESGVLCGVLVWTPHPPVLSGPGAQ